MALCLNLRDGVRVSHSSPANSNSNTACTPSYVINRMEEIKTPTWGEQMAVWTSLSHHCLCTIHSHNHYHHLYSLSQPPDTTSSTHYHQILTPLPPSFSVLTSTNHHSLSTPKTTNHHHHYHHHKCHSEYAHTLTDFRSESNSYTQWVAFN